MLRTMFAFTAGVLIAVPTWAATPAQSCQANKNKTAGKYEYCRQKVEAKYALTADSAARTLGLRTVSASTVRSGRRSNPRPRQRAVPARAPATRPQSRA